MNYLTLEHVTRTYGEKVLFKDLELQINQGQKVGLIAKNGSGKSTLLRVIAGLEGSEGPHANVYIKRDLRVGYLQQEPSFDKGHTILEAVLASENPIIKAILEYEEALLFPEHHDKLQTAITKLDDLKAWDMEARIKEVLFRLNLQELNKRVATLSGGQLKRLALAKLLCEEPEFMILDEPTNHLDLDMIEWLENYLQHPGMTLFMVTHDRYFLENVCDTIVELDKGILYKYKGNYGEYLEKKAARQENEAVVQDKLKQLYKKELDWVNRSPMARTTKAKSRVDQFEEIKNKVQKKRENNAMQIDIKASYLGSKILEAHSVSKSYENKLLIDKFSYKFKRNDKVGIVGPNGTGKSTLLKILTQSVHPDAGKVVSGETTRFGYYTQDGIQLKEDKRVIEVITDIAEYIPLEKGLKLSAHQLLERFMFPRDQHMVYVSQLSGGEKRRLYLLTILMSNPNFLILDEPTNDLDVLTLNVLEDFLLDFPGVVLVVTHDRFFMDKLVEHLFVFEGNGQIRDFPGNYSDYRVVAELEEQERKAKEKEDKERQNRQAGSGTTQNPAGVGLTQEQKKELKKIEKEIAQLEQKKSSVTEAFNDMSLTPDKITELSKQLAAIQNELEEKEMRWLELAEQA